MSYYIIKYNMAAIVALIIISGDLNYNVESVSFNSASSVCVNMVYVYTILKAQANLF